MNILFFNIFDSSFYLNFSLLKSFIPGVAVRDNLFENEDTNIDHCGVL